MSWPLTGGMERRSSQDTGSLTLTVSPVVRFRQFAACVNPFVIPGITSSVRGTVLAGLEEAITMLLVRGAVKPRIPATFSVKFIVVPLAGVGVVGESAVMKFGSP